MTEKTKKPKNKKRGRPKKKLSELAERRISIKIRLSDYNRLRSIATAGNNSIIDTFKTVVQTYEGEVK